MEDYFGEEKERIFSEYNSKVLDFKNSKDGEWKLVTKEDLKIGDHIYASYTTLSQKYMYDYVDECGRIIKIKKDETTGNILDIKIRNHENKVINLMKIGCGVYGTGYDVLFYRLKKNPIKRKLNILSNENKRSKAIN